MKSKDLRYPLLWEDRRPILHERVLFVPRYYHAHDAWHKLPWNDPSMFANDHPVAVEYCSGNGDWIISKALADPGKNWIAVEKRFDRVRKIWAKMRNRSLNNLLIVCGEAQAFTRHYLFPHSIHEIYINFPDPWPKRGHAKHRLIQQDFVKDMARATKKGGAACLVTDDPDYSAQMVREMKNSSLWKPQIPDPHYTSAWPGYGDSFFDTLWRAKGCTIRYHLFTHEIYE